MFSIKTFQGILQMQAYVERDRSKPYSIKLKFTKSQILFSEGNKNVQFQNNDSLFDKAFYKLIVIDDVRLQRRYQIEFSNNQKYYLGLDKRQERRLKWVHKMYRIQKEPLAFAAIIISIISIIVTAILGVLQLKYNSFNPRG